MSSRTQFRVMSATTVIRALPSGRPQIISKTGIAQVRSRLTAEQAKSPAQVSRAFNDLVTNVEESTQSLRNDPAARKIYFYGVVFASGVTKTLTHNLGRPFQGYFVTRTYAGASAPIMLQDGALPSGTLPSSSIALVPSATGTADICIW